VPIDSVGVLPWLDIRDQVVVGDITFYRAEDALALLGERAEILADRLRIYREAWEGEPVRGTIALHRDQLEGGGDCPPDVLRRAVDILMISALFKNDGELRQQNATTFTVYIQRLGGEAGFMATSTRRRNGGVFMGTSTGLVMTKPLYAEHFSSYSRPIRDALVAAWSVPEDASWRFLDSLEWFRRASTDADNVEPVVDLVLILTGVDFLLAHPGTAGAGLDYARVQALLAPYQKIPCCSVRSSRVQRCHIEAVLFALNAVRNASVHPRRLADAEMFGFRRVDKPTFAWLADRCFMALMVGRLIELGVLEPTDAMEAFIVGVERWIHDPTKDVGLVIVEAKRDIGLRRVFLEMHDRELAVGCNEGELDPLRSDWERDFFLALGNVEPPWRIALVWLSDGRGVVEIYETGTKGEELREYMLLDPESDSATRWAYAALAFPEGDSPPGHARELTDEDKRAMQDLGLWIHGGSQAI
jgi:hypothetical protein